MQNPAGQQRCKTHSHTYTTSTQNARSEICTCSPWPVCFTPRADHTHHDLHHKQIGMYTQKPFRNSTWPFAWSSFAFFLHTRLRSNATPNEKSTCLGCKPIAAKCSRTIALQAPATWFASFLWLVDLLCQPKLWHFQQTSINRTKQIRDDLPKHTSSKK